jgi:hypothetical protein
MHGGRNKMPTEKESLDYFGQFLIKNYRDKALKTLEIAIANKWKNKSYKDFQKFLQSLTEQQQKVLFDGFQLMLDGALHDLLFNIQEENHFISRIKILVDGYDAIQISDGIHGEQFGENGWIEKYSQYSNE